ncbi:MAG: CotH kinase family protein [Bacteroidota bacterium]
MNIPFLRFSPILLMIALQGIPQLSKGQTLTDSNLPIVIMDTHGQTILDDPRIIVDMGIIYNGYGVRNFVTDPQNDYFGQVAIEIRGSTSQQYTKKSYGFETRDSVLEDTNVSLLQMPEENDWILYGAYPDKSLIRNSFAYYIFNRMGHYASRTKHVELVRNGSYRGVYELMEKIKRGDARVDIAKLTPADISGDSLTGGYIIKIDKTTGSGTEFWYSSYDTLVFFQYEYPEDSELVQVQKDYIQNYIYEFETALQGPLFMDPDSGYIKYIDEQSFIDFFLMQELGRTVDGYRSSCFMYKDKDSRGGKLTMGPLWDFNLSFGNCDYCAAFDTTGFQYQFNSICTGYDPHVPFWWGRLLQDPDYANEMRCRWKQMRESFLNTDSVNAWIDSMATYLDESQQRNFQKWQILGQYVNWNYFVGQTYEEEIDYMKTWIADRSTWLDNNLPGVCNITTSIKETGNNISCKFYPNPFSHATVLQVQHAGGNVSELALNIFDVTGRNVFQKNVEVRNQSAKEVLQLELNPGIYFYSIGNSQTKASTGKLIVQ